MYLEVLRATCVLPTNLVFQLMARCWADRRRDRAWIEQHFADPPKLAPGSSMPNFQFNARDLKLITDYITAIPK